MKSIYYCIVTAVFLLCCLAVPGVAQSGDTQEAAGKKAPSGATGSLGSGGVMGNPPVGAMGPVPVGATGSPGSGGVTGKTAPQGVMRRVYTQDAPVTKKDSKEPEEDDTE
jgi:hypothetical protein